VDEAYLSDWWNFKVMPHQHATCIDWETFKKRGIYKFILPEPHVAFRKQIRDGIPFETASGKIEILSTELAQITDWTRTRYGTRDSLHSEVDRTVGIPQQREDEEASLPSHLAAPALAHPFDFQQHWLAARNLHAGSHHVYR
jgi:hypothetical protein